MDALKLLTAKLQHHTLNDLLIQATDDEVSFYLDDMLKCLF